MVGRFSGLKGRFCQPRAKPGERRCGREFDPQRVVHERSVPQESPLQGDTTFLRDEPRPPARAGRTGPSGRREARWFRKSANGVRAMVVVIVAAASSACPTASGQAPDISVNFRNSWDDPKVMYP